MRLGAIRRAGTLQLLEEVREVGVARTRAFLARTEGGLGHAEAGLCEGAPGFVGVGCLFVHSLEAGVGALGGREVAAGEGEVVQQAGERG